MHAGGAETDKKHWFNKTHSDHSFAIFDTSISVYHHKGCEMNESFEIKLDLVIEYIRCLKINEWLQIKVHIINHPSH